jgi:hypothetical protein
MICIRLDSLEIRLHNYQHERRMQSVREGVHNPEAWPTRELTLLNAIMDHKREGHNGFPCTGD